MKTTPLKFWFLIVSVLFILSAQNVLACSCHGFDTPYEAYKNADAVFVGKVVSIKDGQGKEIGKNKKDYDFKDYYSLNEGNTEFNQLQIQEWFKGDYKSNVIVETDINMCEFGFSLDDTILVYAYKNKSDNNLSTSTFCSRTKPISYAQSDIFFLRELLANKPEPRIYGSIYLRDKNLATGKDQEISVEKVKIIAQKGKQKYVTYSDKNGLFRFPKLPDGEYKVYPDLPTKYARDWSFYTLENITLEKNLHFSYRYFESRGPTAYTDFALRWNNSVSGKVLDAEGKEVERATIRLIPSNQINNEPFNKETNIGEMIRGKYVEAGNNPGKYILALEIFSPFDSGQSKLRIYYPQTTKLDKAEIITLGESTQKNIDIKLPEGFIVREIEGSLLLGSETPIKHNGWVSIEKMEDTNHPNNIVYDSRSVTDGKFKFQVYENAEYWIHGEFYSQKSKPIKIKVGKINEPIKVIIPNFL